MVIYKKYMFVLLFLFGVQLLYSDTSSNFNSVMSIPYEFSTRSIDWAYSEGFIDKIDLIGWSRNGLLAYRYSDDGVLGWIYCFTIVNTITDEIVEQDSIASWVVHKEEEIEAYVEKWNLLLEKNNIVGKVVDPCAKIDENTAIGFPFGNYGCWFDYTVSEISSFNEKTLMYNWKLIIGNEFVQKIVTQQITRDPNLVRIKIIGYYKSPYENRIAIFISSISTHSGNVYFTPIIYGCNMNVGLN